MECAAMGEVHQIQSSTKLHYLVPLCDFEKILLTELGTIMEEKHFSASATRDCSTEEVFRWWRWEVSVSRGLESYLYGETFEREFQSDQNLAYTAFTRSLSKGGMTEYCMARADLIESANPDFVARLGKRPFTDLET
jgi:hypothetical protein